MVQCSIAVYLKRKGLVATEIHRNLVATLGAATIADSKVTFCLCGRQDDGDAQNSERCTDAANSAILTALGYESFS
jgi:hypothetical protein